MPGPGELAQQPARIIGRAAGLARLRGLVDQVPLASQVLLVTGDAGMGKTMLLADAARRARSAGMRGLSVTGRESESRFAVAGLHQDPKSTRLNSSHQIISYAVFCFKKK